MIQATINLIGVISTPVQTKAKSDGTPYISFRVKSTIASYTGDTLPADFSVAADKGLCDTGKIVQGTRVKITGTLIPHKVNNQVYLNVSAQAIDFNDVPSGDSVKGTMEFRGVAGKRIDVKTTKTDKKMVVWSAFSATKEKENFEYIWVNFRYLAEKPAFLVEKARFTAKGTLELSPYKGKVDFSCMVSEMAEYVPAPYTPKDGAPAAAPQPVDDTMPF